MNVQTTLSWCFAFSIILCIVFFIFMNIYFFKKKYQIDEMIKQKKKNIEEKILKSQLTANQIISDTEKKITLLKKETENDLKERSKIIINLEEKIIHKEELLAIRNKYLNEKEESLDNKEQTVNNNKQYIEELKRKAQDIINQQQFKLEKIANLTKEQAQELLIKEEKKNIDQNINNYIREKEKESKIQVQKKAKILLITTMEKISREIISAQNISVIYLENNDLKGKIIGKEGRNIKTFEIITGVDLIIDDAPNTVILSSFDPIRREIAKKTLETLIKDGRITPSSIEETFQKKSVEIEEFIQEIGEEAVYETKIGFIDSYLVKLLGKLYFRTSYGQNVLNHSLEVSYLAGKLAAEIGENETIARRAGLLHDIGKALDHQTEGSHVKIGIDLATKYQEPKEVIDSIASHHEEQESSTFIAVLVKIADIFSSGRPGARKESLENYIQRVTQLEKISNNIEGVEKSYAIRSGREIRVIVKSDKCDDLTTFMIAQKIKKQFQKNINYNGNIKITVLREFKVIEIAEINNKTSINN